MNLDPGSPDTLFLGTHRMYRSLDGGSKWSVVGPDDMASGPARVKNMATRAERVVTLPAARARTDSTAGS